jgi:glycosyltransferase involved in cell wall biosynthesis
LFYASPRIPGLVKYLPEFGWEAIVVTVPIGEDPEARFGPPNDFKDKYRVVETEGYQQKGDIGEQAMKRFNLASRKSYWYVMPLLRIAYRFYSEIFHYPDKEKKWSFPAIKVAETFLEHEKVDAVISSSSPVTCHIIARELKNKHKIPWVADLRDLWTQNHNYPYSSLRRIIERRLEVAVLSHADALVTVTRPWAERLRDLHKREEVYTITNGFDSERLNKEETGLTSKFTITYTGQIYAGKQDPLKLLVALRDLIDDGTIEAKDAEVRSYGPEREVLTREIEKYGLAGIAKQYGVVPRQVAHEKQRESQILLLLKWEDPQEFGVYPGKIFEYLAARRPILATGGSNDVVTELLNETKAGIDVASIGDIENALRKLYREYKFKGEIAYSGDIEKIDKYSHREMARKFSEVLNNLTGDI